MLVKSICGLFQCDKSSGPWSSVFRYGRGRSAANNQGNSGGTTMRTKRSSRVTGLAMPFALIAGGMFLASLLSACAATSQGQVALQQ
jgi:hypothetical protein